MPPNIYREFAWLSWRLPAKSLCLFFSDILLGETGHLWAETKGWARLSCRRLADQQDECPTVFAQVLGVPRRPSSLAFPSGRPPVLSLPGRNPEHGQRPSHRNLHERVNSFRGMGSCGLGPVTVGGPSGPLPGVLYGVRSSGTPYNGIIYGLSQPNFDLRLA